MAVAVEDEYAEVAGLPLDTPAWSHENLGELYQSAPMRGSGLEVAQRYGERPRARVPRARPVDCVLLVNGHSDSDGNATTSLLAGIRANLDELKTALRPRLNADGTLALRHVLDDGSVRTGVCQLQGEVEVAQAGETVRCVVPLWLPDGVLRSAAATSASATDAFPLTVGNVGSADQFDSVITLSGDATSVTLSNATWGDATDLTVAVDLSAGDVTVDTDAMTAVQGTNSVVASVSWSTDGAFAGRWLPLLAGADNSIGVSHDGTTLTVSVEHYPRWL